MGSQRRMPRYSVYNDGAGPYAVFYCDKCDREYRSQPDIGRAVAQDIGRDVAGGFLRRIPIFGRAVADNVVGEDPRYIRTLTPQQLEAAWKQVEDNFRECPTCRQIVCVSDFDMKAGYCNDDSPRKGEIAEAEAEQAAGVIKGLANAFGIGAVVREAVETAKSAAARCPKDGTVAPAGTKFCPQCGTAMIQPASATCPSCGAATQGAKFCPQCGTKIEQQAAPATCSSCGAATQGGRFCPNCGAPVD